VDPLPADADDEGVVASALELIEIAEVTALLGAGDAARTGFSEGELSYARARSDPERRLAARLAAKRAAARLLGGGVDVSDVEVVRARGGPPALRFSPRALERLRALGASRALVSLTHADAQAAAAVLLLRDEW
jgi:holo-[acyl-carrier protein] synthase